MQQEHTYINSDAITPLWDKRVPKPSKTATDYGIDDINTDDSEDDVDSPRKVVPEWAKRKFKINIFLKFYDSELLLINNFL